MSKLGLEADKVEADITKTYSETLKNLVDAGIASAEQAQAAAENIERRFINKEGNELDAGQGTTVQADNQSPVGAMAGQPGNSGLL